MKRIAARGSLRTELADTLNLTSMRVGEALERIAIAAARQE